MPNVLAVDGNSLAHRAFHALRPEASSRSAVGDLAPEDGHFVTRGVVRMLASAWIEGPFDAVVIAFDSRANRRKELYPEYKANRPDKDPELRRQLELLGHDLRACGLSVLQVEGAEADDLLATIADGCGARGWRCAVLSSDRDLLALVSATTRLLRPRQSMADLGVYDPAAVVAEFDVRPDQYTDLAALRGDPSDGLSGAKGIGPKIAARLLRDYGDIPGIYANLSNLQPKVEAALRTYRDDVERNLLLMAPLPNLVVDLDAIAAAGVDVAGCERTLLPLGMGAEVARLRHAVERPPLPPRPPPPTAAPDEVVRVPDEPVRREVVPIAAGEQVALF